MIAKNKKVIYYTLENGSSPFEKWLKKLDNLSRAIVVRLIQRVATGGAKKSIKALKDGLYEIKIAHGPGYRVYFVEDGVQIILLLVGGDGILKQWLRKYLSRHDELEGVVDPQKSDGVTVIQRK